MSATAQGEVQEIFEDMVAKPESVNMLEFKSEYEYATKNSTINANLVTLPKDEKIIGKIIDHCASLYPLKPVICFVEEAQFDEIRRNALAKEWIFYDSSQLAQLINSKRGILLLKPEEYRGLNTQFAVNAYVLIGCQVTSEAQYY